MPLKWSGWKQKIVTFAGGLGAPGLFLISFLDSSVLTFPIINDLLVIDLSIQHPARMPLYASMAALGSLLDHAHSIRHWVERNGFAGMLVAALLPPPTPFKVFVLAAGVFEVPLVSFASAIALARLFRYFGIGYLAIRYGADAMPYLAHHKLEVTVFVFALVTVSYVLSRLVLRRRPEHGKTN